MKKNNYTINGKSYQVTVNKIEDSIAEVEVNGTLYQVNIDQPAHKQDTPAKPHPLPVVAAAPPAQPPKEKTALGCIVRSPLPGVIISIDCKVGDVIKKGQKLLVLEAMKMENTIPAERDGVVSEIKVNTGDTVSESADLVILTTSL